MSKVGWATAALYSRTLPSLLTHMPRAAPLRQKPLRPIVKVETDGVRWAAVMTAPMCERRVADELAALGFRTYCPFGQKFVYFQAGKRMKKKIVTQFPLLSRYIFVGAFPGMIVSRHASDRILAVLGDYSGPIEVPAAALSYINDLELEGKWDATKFKPEESPFVHGARVTLLQGPMAGFPATVDALESEDRLRVLVTMFGRVSPVIIEPQYAEVG